MNKVFNISDKIGQIVAIFPGASNLFLEYRIDFCCGGDRPLEEAIKEQNLDSNKILTLLNDRYKVFKERNEEFTDWAKERPSRLVDYVIETHHQYLNEELPKISELTLKILKVHGKTHEELFKVHKLFNALRTELEEHLVKEESLVFPMIKRYELEKNNDNRDKLLKLLNELEGEHTGAGDIIKELREVTDHYIVPKDACKTFEVTYRKLRELEEDTFQHIHLENNILFKNI
ncbi:regulator of cell morphogenesis and NO signaling [Clostridium cavendishii DSM 21758]|uniref:Regulator of cell morphogenesis and NO signaling n=1 Tax=Clostridium cavendishii DSM 21758 TaxID=1121302 RepID=A0A1M6QWU8_9CLOT|nr:iron-sulfur cluster repair di-iron protein [Clostridium cavendishii]SHK24674.1 regulator of cell morphogenesis and NO signaling [Clostridium cavendishii DSM 21758]